MRRPHSWWWPDCVVATLHDSGLAGQARRGVHMPVQGAYGVGRFSVEFEIANHVDIIDLQRGLLTRDKVRRLTIRAVVDSGATKLVLPGKVAKQLGLPSLGKVKVR